MKLKKLKNSFLEITYQLCTKLRVKAIIKLNPIQSTAKESNGVYINLSEPTFQLLDKLAKKHHLSHEAFIRSFLLEKIIPIADDAYEVVEELADEQKLSKKEIVRKSIANENHFWEHRKAKRKILVQMSPTDFDEVFFR